ncbi:MAG: hypothetical protein ISS52_02040 [Dehalococcoidia bacterium]|nr:hypothetical protein [Dehalococcoidia bacterium]
MTKTWGMVSFALFCIGLVVAVIAGLVVPANVIVTMVLAILGLVIGILYVVYAKDINTLLLATIALLAMTAAFAPIAVLGVGEAVTSIVVNFAALMAPIALVAAITALLKIGLAR